MVLYTHSSCSHPAVAKHAKANNTRLFRNIREKYFYKERSKNRQTYSHPKSDFACNEPVHIIQYGKHDLFLLLKSPFLSEARSEACISVSIISYTGLKNYQ